VILKPEKSYIRLYSYSYIHIFTFKDGKGYGKDIFSWFFFKDEELVKDEELDDDTVSIQGTGEMVRLIFSSDRSVTKRGFFAKYNVMQGISLMLSSKEA